MLRIASRWLKNDAVESMPQDAVGVDLKQDHVACVRCCEQVCCVQLVPLQGLQFRVEALAFGHHLWKESPRHRRQAELDSFLGSNCSKSCWLRCRRPGFVCWAPTGDSATQALLRAAPLQSAAASRRESWLSHAASTPTTHRGMDGGQPRLRTTARRVGAPLALRRSRP